LGFNLGETSAHLYSSRKIACALNLAKSVIGTISPDSIKRIFQPTMAAINLWTQYQRLENLLQLKILFFAGREAAASFRIACGKEDTHPREVLIAEQAILYEPFTYWDWQEKDASFRAAQRQEGSSIDSSVVDDGKYKRRLLWERERAFRVNGEWHEYPTPEKRWEAFKSGLEKNYRNRKYVKRIAVAPWMRATDIKWYGPLLL
jgi:hypothetical protein